VPWPAPGVKLDSALPTARHRTLVSPRRGQSESIAHAAVCCATHIFEVMERQVLPASQIAGTGNRKPESGPGRNGGMGTSLQGTVMLVWYGARTTVAWFGRTGSTPSRRRSPARRPLRHRPHRTAATLAREPRPARMPLPTPATATLQMRQASSAPPCSDTVEPWGGRRRPSRTGRQ
jgi:hypothetical protein